MKSREEIEEKIGFELEYKEWETFSNGNDYNNFTSEVIKHRELEPKSYNALKDLLIESLESGDIETANLCESIINATDDKTMKSDSEFISKKQELQLDFLEKYIFELQEIDIDSIDKSKVEELLDNYELVSKFEKGQDIDNKKQQLSEIIQEKVEGRIQALDSQITELKEHLELPENEQKTTKLQEEIENIEEVYLEFKVKAERSREEKQWKGKERTAFNSPRGEEQIRSDLQRETLNHRQKRIQEQGKAISDIMQEIAEYKAVRLDGRSPDDYYVKSFNSLNKDVVKKTEYLEQRLAFLREHKEIEGNETRIKDIEQQIETMQDSWIVAQKGYNNIDGIIQTAESRKNELQNNIEQYKKELETIDPMSRMYLQKRDQIEDATKEMQKYEKYIDKMFQTKDEIESGKNINFMGEHHKARLQREETERVESSRSRIAELDNQVEELAKHIETPENEEKIAQLQAEIDEIESKMPSDRENRKRARADKQGISKEDILENINEVIKEDNSPYVDWKAQRVEKQIETRVAFLKQKSDHLQQHLDIEGNDNVGLSNICHTLLKILVLKYLICYF